MNLDDHLSHVPPAVRMRQEDEVQEHEIPQPPSRVLPILLGSAVLAVVVPVSLHALLIVIRWSWRLIG